MTNQRHMQKHAKRALRSELDAKSDPTEGRTLVYGVGLLLGVASGTVGVAGGFFELRLWHILLCIAFFLAILQRRVAATGPIRLFPHDMVAVVFVSWALVSEYINSSDLVYGFKPINAIVGSLFVMAYWSVRLVITSVDDAMMLLKGFVLPTFPLALLSAAQAGSTEVSRWILTLVPAQGLANRIADGRLIRATGLVGHWTGLGFFFCAMLAASLIFLLVRREQGGQTAALISVVSAVVGVFSSLTLSAILTACVILLSAAQVSRRKLWPSVSILVIILVIWYYFGDLLGERIQQQVATRSEYLPQWVPNTIAYRYRIWSEQTVPVALERPFWGWGNNLYSPERDRPYQLSWISAESQWLAQWVNAGLVAMLLLGFLIASMVLVGLKLSRIAPNGKRYYPFVALVVMSFYASFTASVFTNRGLTIPLWALFGVISGLVCVYENRGQVRGRYLPVGIPPR